MTLIFYNTNCRACSKGDDVVQLVVIWLDGVISFETSLKKCIEEKINSFKIEWESYAVDFKY